MMDLHEILFDHMTDAAAAYSRTGGDMKWEPRVSKAANAVRTAMLTEEKVRKAVAKALIESDPMFRQSVSGRVFVTPPIGQTTEIRINEITSNVVRDLVWGS